MENLPYIVQMFILAVGVLIAYLLYLVVRFLIKRRPRRPKEPGFEYIFVNEDGTARELDDDEVKYLSATYYGGDGNRPYIKLNYEERTPDGKLHGYLRRRQVPKGIKIKS
jgi:hypothetical protein